MLFLGFIFQLAYKGNLEEVSFVWQQSDEFLLFYFLIVLKQ